MRIGDRVSTSCRSEARKVIRGTFLQDLENHMRGLDFTLRASGILLRIYIFEFAYTACSVGVVGDRTGGRVTVSCPLA